MQLILTLSVYKVTLNELIKAVLKVFEQKLNLEEQNIIKKCRLPRNRLIHASFVEFLIELNGEAPGREIDPSTGKHKSLEKDDIVEGAKCIERSRGIDDFSINARKAVEILELKVLRQLNL